MYQTIGVYTLEALAHNDFALQRLRRLSAMYYAIKDCCVDGTGERVVSFYVEYPTYRTQLAILGLDVMGKCFNNLASVYMLILRITLPFLVLQYISKHHDQTHYLQPYLSLGYLYPK